jgi:hypothetical protein
MQLALSLAAPRHARGSARRRSVGRVAHAAAHCRRRRAARTLSHCCFIFFVLVLILVLILVLANIVFGNFETYPHIVIS